MITNKNSEIYIQTTNCYLSVFERTVTQVITSPYKFIVQTHKKPSPTAEKT